ncbi:LCP family protein [Boudabousia liubingyangii]|nr:LCP family protein [Boudabousia liubingyangii]
MPRSQGNDGSRPPVSGSPRPAVAGTTRPVARPSSPGQSNPANPRTYPAAPQSGSPEGAPSGPRGPQAPRPRRKKSPFRWVRRVLLLILVLLVVWPTYLYFLVSGNLDRVPALSEMAETPGVTYLVAGSDARSPDGIPDDGTEGERTDSMMLIHKADNGQAVVVSLPRDTDVEVPGHGHQKLNAAYAFGGAPLLVSTVEDLTGLKIDHFVLVHMGGVERIVDAVGGVELCYDADVHDPKSELNWQKGCHLADGKTALAFARMRYSDPRGDIGRQDRQRQVIAAVVKNASSASTILNPIATRDLALAASQALSVDESTSPFALGKLALAYRAANKNEMLGTPPIADLNYRNGHGAAVLLSPAKAGKFFEDLKNGTLQKEQLNQFTNGD